MFKKTVTLKMLLIFYYLLISFLWWLYTYTGIPKSISMKPHITVSAPEPYIVHNTYINANINRKIQLWLDIGSNVWNMKIEKDISNPLVLRKSFKKKIYSDEMEENYKKYYL